MNQLGVEALLELEHAGWASLCRSGGGEFYGRLMLPDALMVLVNGMVLDRPTIIASLDDAPPWASFKLTGPRRVALGVDSAALLYRARAQRDSEEEAFVALMSSIYCVVDGVARLALYQQTTITH